MITRQDKIKFLKGLINGEANVSSLLSEETAFILSMNDNKGNIKHTCKGKELTEEEFNGLNKRINKSIDLTLNIERTRFND